MAASSAQQRRGAEAQAPVAGAGPDADLVNLISTNANATVYPSDDALLSTFQQRFRADTPYTNLSSSNLVVLNPFRTLANLNDASAEQYRKRCFAEPNWEQERKESPTEALPPHPYDLAARVYHAMLRTKKSQAIVFNGSTESGKSFASKLITSQLLRLASSSGKREQRLAEQLRALDTVLTSFGCAKTKMNANASRHSRYLELHFNFAGRLEAAKVLTFGLDKQRLCSLGAEERTFHVFYQLLAGATQQERDLFHLDDVTSYALLAQSGCYRLPGGPTSDDSIAMDELRASMKILGFKQKHIASIFSLLSAILLLGNIEFADPGARADLDSEAAHVSNRAALEDAAELLGVDIDTLEQALTTRTRFVRKELVCTYLKADAAAGQRDNLVRDLYATLFAFVVETANHKIAPVTDDAFPLHIVQLDLPGYQSRSASSLLAPGSPAAALASQAGPNTYEEFASNVQAELLQNWLVRRVLDDTQEPAAGLVADGITLPEIVTGENTACVELLRGSVVGSAATDRKPTGLLGTLDRTVTKVRSGKLADKDELLLAELDEYAVHGSYIASSAAASSTSGAARKAFGINHYQGSCLYAIDGFLERELDLFDSAFVIMLRKTSNSFIAKLFAGPSLATESHPQDENTVVVAQVSARPLRTPTPLRRDADFDLLLDSSKVYPVSRQLNATLSELLGVVATADHIWTVTCIRPNDITQPNSFDSRRVKSQVRALLLPDLVARKRNEYFAGFTFDDFCLRYHQSVIPAAVAAGVTESKDKIQAFAIGNALRDGTDYVLGQEKVWLAYAAWRRLEDRLRLTEPSDIREPGSSSEGTTPLDEKLSYPPGNSRQSSYMLSPGAEADLGTSKGAFAESTEELLLRPQASISSDPFRSQTNLAAGVGAGKGVAGWGADTDPRAYGDVDPVTLEKDLGLGDKGIDAVEEVKTTAIRRWWVRLCWLMTWWIPSFMLSKLGGMKRPDVRQAWREKVTICMLIFLLCCTVLFYILVFGRLLCPNQNKAWNADQLSTHAGPNDFYVAVYGKVYDLTNFYKQQHSDTTLKVTSDIMFEVAGQDLTKYFPVPLTVGCPGLVTDVNTVFTLNDNYTMIIQQINHASGPQSPYLDSALRDIDWYPNRFLPRITKYYKGYYVTSKSDVASEASWKNWAIVGDHIYDLTNYINTVSLSNNASSVSWLPDSISNLFTSQAGMDITADYEAAKAELSPIQQRQVQLCMDNVFYAGRWDFRETARCQVQNYLLLAFSCLICLTLVAKFLAALQLTSKRNPEQQDKFVICQVPCYTEGEDELRKTIDSLAGMEYDDKRKLLFIICDGMIVGSGNDLPTPRIVLDILGVDPKLDPEPLMFKSIAEGSKQLNYGKVYSGLYEFEGHVVPYIVVVKCGRPSERQKPGNRGKRDTQVLLMRYLNRVHFDSPMAPLELEIYHQMKNVIGVDPAFYEYILMVDADTRVDPDSLTRLVAVAADDSRVIAVCGETRLDNEERSWTTMIQVYEYYISHHLAKAFESLFGSVTCLPGCFSMYRIRSADKGRPLFISNRIIDDYSENRVDTLHKKNLLSLGEDRYLTTLILKNFPAFRTKFTPDAHARTAAPDRWGVLLSQRRRWINSTIHNLAELLLMPELCGFCLFSMRFVVFLDLLSTIILPATVIYLVYLIVSVSTGTGQFPLISIIMIAATYGLQIIIFLVKRQWQYIGWMLFYMLGFPIFSFFLPIYSFWHMDDFSWGNTRIVVGEKGNKKIIAGTDDGEPFFEEMIPLKKFSEYQRDVWKQPAPTVATSIRSGHTGFSHSPFGNQAGIAMGLSKGGSSYAGSVAGSEYGGTDYYRDTNVLNHSRKNSASLSASKHGAAPAAGAAGAGTHPMSMGMNMPHMMGGGGSGAPSPSFYGMPPMAQSMYGMPPMGTPSVYGMPVMGGTPNFFPPGPGSVNGSDAGSHFGHGILGGTAGIPRDSTMPLGNGALDLRPQSTGTNLNMFTSSPSTLSQLAPNPIAAPTDDDLRQAVRRFLSLQPDLNNVTKRSTREAVIASFPNASLGDRKAFINQAIDETLSGSPK
ncbi:hypothetical protein V8E36_006533 [Tilletia maclaganii]